MVYCGLVFIDRVCEEDMGCFMVFFDDRGVLLFILLEVLFFVVDLGVEEFVLVVVVEVIY